MFVNPFYVPKWNVEDNCSFLKHYHEIFEKNSKLYCLENFYYLDKEFFNSNFYRRVKPKILLDKMYFEGKFVYQALACSYSEFCYYMEGGLPRRFFNYSSLNRWCSRVFGWFYHHHHERMAYSRQPEHNKKVLSQEEQNRRAWREEKQVEKDKAKCGRSLRCGKYYKRLAHKTHRSWQRNCIKTEKYEELLNKNKLHEYQDPWLWD